MNFNLNASEIENYQYKRTVPFFNDDEAYPTECQSGKQPMLIGTISIAFTVMYMFPILVSSLYFPINPLQIWFCQLWHWAHSLGS